MEVDLIQSTLTSVGLTAPLIVLMITGLALLVADVLAPADCRPKLLVGLSVAGMIGGLIALQAVGAPAPGEARAIFGGVLTHDYLTFLAQHVLLAGGLFVVLISPRYINTRPIAQGEYYALLVFCVMAMMALAASTELLTLFLNLELVSIILYVLAGMEKRNARATEAAFKYFLLGSMAGAFLLMGIAFVFGSAGVTHYASLAGAIENNALVQPVFLVFGVALMLAGFFFKLTLAPFHMYAPDVYDGSPTPVAALLATGTKVAGFTALYHLFKVLAPWSGLPDNLWLMLYIVVVVSLVIGNLGAIIQPRFKRMMAYSSIAHSAYLMMPLVVVLQRPELLEAARDALAYYLLAYAIMTLLAFGVSAVLEDRYGDVIGDWAGLAGRHKGLAIMMSLAMFSLIGIPPLVGFMGKLGVLSVLVEGEHIGLAITMVVASVASVYYYLRVTVTLFMQESAEPAGLSATPVLTRGGYLVLVAVAAALFVFAVFQSIYLFAS